MLKTLNIGQRCFEVQNSITETISNSVEDTYYSELVHYTVIDIIGDGAKNFLQGQLTNDIFQLKPHLLSKQLLCNIKGQIVAKILIVEIENRLHLILEKDLWPEVKALLDKTARLSRVDFQENSKLKVYGCVSSHALENTYKINTTQSLYLGEAFPFSLSYIKKPSLFWHFISIQNNEFSIYPTTCRQYLPKPLGLEEEWIHFNKGCYRGQEIIARMHFLGKDKYHLRHQTLEWTTQTQPGYENIIDLCPINDHQALAIVMCAISSHK